MSAALLCKKCGGPLPVEASDHAVACSFCGTTSNPDPRVVEKVVTVDHVVERVVVRDASGAVTTLACLRCGTSMHDAHIGATAVTHCGTCGGVWLDAQTVERLTRESDEALKKYVIRAELFASYKPELRELRCPVCEAPMSRVEVPMSVQYVIDVCSLHGAWFDRAELVAFINGHAEARAGDVTEDDLESAGVRGGGFFAKIRSLLGS